MIARVVPTEPCLGLLRMQGFEAPCALGRGGIARDKREGDGATPAGTLPLRRVLFRADRLARPPTAVVPCSLLDADDLWCDDPSSRDYNRTVRRPFADRAEALWRDDGAYDVIGVLGWNDAPVERGRGSAIFLHASARLEPTAGCVALRLPDLLRALAAGLSGIEVPAVG